MVPRFFACPPVVALVLLVFAAPAVGMQEQAPEVEYAFERTSSDARTWTAANPAQGFRSRLSADGWRVTGAARDGRPWSLGLRLAAWGRGDRLAEVEDGRARRNGERLEIRRGELVEWYVNDERGVEQGFTIEAPPPCAEAHGAEPVRLALAIDGGFSPRVRPGGRDVLLASRDPELLVHFTGLRAWDAGGRNVAAAFSLEGERLVIRVEDEGAAYPLTVDPLLWIEQAKLIASDAFIGDEFGHSVAISGDTALVGTIQADGAASQTGAAYVFVRSGTTWTEQARLAASDGAYLDAFGSAVSVYGDTALVGASLDDLSTTNDTGSAYVFVRTGTTWSQQAKLTPFDGVRADHFGSAVSVFGDTALVGAHMHDYGYIDAGGAYVFVRSGASWSHQAKLLPGDSAGAVHFGNAVSVSGDLALVGKFWDFPMGWHSGSAYVFRRSGTLWSQEAKLFPADGGISARFGQSLCLSGDTALIGAGDDDDLGMGAGSAYVFVRAGTAWSEQAKLLASDGEAFDKFGVGVALAGDAALIGAYGDDDGGASAGAVYTFLRTGTTWSEHAKLTPGDAVAHGEFGRGLAASGDTALVSAHGDDQAGYMAGAAYVLVWEAVASATFRNAGSNPASYAAVTLPVLGTTYSSTVDLGGTTGHSFALLVGFLAPLTMPLGGGQVLLVDVFDPSGELLMQSAVAGPLAAYDVPVPADPSFAGIETFTQVLHFGGVLPFALSNALDLFLGL